MIEKQKFFEENDYVIINNFFNDSLLDVLFNQCELYTVLNGEEKLREKNNDKIITTGEQPIGHYGTVITDSLMLSLTDFYSRLTQKKLAPTYSYYRKYLKGNNLVLHNDRASCQYSATINLRSFNNNIWPFYVLHDGKQPSEAIKLTQTKNDIILYKGVDLWHGREALEFDWSSHIFCHWVDIEDEKYKHHVYDGRSSLGIEWSG